MSDLVPFRDDDPVLIQDVRAMDALAARARPEVAAMERGVRTYPDGMTEQYARIELR